MNRVQFRYHHGDGYVDLRPFVDGQDLLAEYRNDQGQDPDRLLPPLSSRLFPTRAGRTVLIGVCSCGETGCGSLATRVRRVGGEVLWEPAPAAQDESLSRGYRFDLTEYLDAIDRAADDPPGEGQGRRVARKVKVMLGLYDQTYDSLTAFQTSKIDWISAWPWTSPVLKASVTSASGQFIHGFSALPGESEESLTARVAAELNRIRYGRPEPGV